MSDPDIPKHIKRDAQKLAYDRAIESINRICDTFGREPAILAAVASSAMSGAFLMMYCAARLQCGEVPPTKLLSAWQDAMSKEFELMEKGFDVAAGYTNMSPEERAHYDS